MVVVFIRNVDKHVPDHGVMSPKSTIWSCTLLSAVGHPMVLLSVSIVYYGRGSALTACPRKPKEATGGFIKTKEHRVPLK